MNKLTIPALLLGIVMIAGIFAFMPVEQASTTHTVMQETSTNYVTVDSTGAAVGSDDAFLITCAATSDACIILEVYLDNDTGNDLNPGAALFDIDGATGEAAFEIVADTGGNMTTDVVIPLSGLSNITLPPSGTIKIAMNGDGTDSAYSLKVLVEAEANTTVTVARVAT